MPRIVVAAPRSGEGKTTVALGIMAALRRRGLRVQGYKVGPDYLDTGYQQYAAGPAGRNLDLFMMGEDAVLEAVAGADADVAVIEGVMGLFDGHRDGVTPTSTADVAARLRAPVVLVLDASRMAASAGAVALGFKSFDPAVDVAGVLLNRWNPSRSRVAVEAALARAGVPVLGYLPVAGDLELPSRHLGLVVADELGAEVAQVMDRLGEWVEEHADVDRLLALARSAPATPARPGAATAAEDAGSSGSGAAGAAAPPVPAPVATPGPRIAVAWDAAFAFYYADNLALLRERGAELVFFSPLEAAELPVCDGLYLGGGYPELHAAGLSANEPLRRDVAAAIARGLPTYAECGGLLYLCESLTDLDGHSWPLVGAVPGRAAMHERLQGMGYREGVLAADSLLGPAGTTVRGHEFHYSTCEIDRSGSAGRTDSPSANCTDSTAAGRGGCIGHPAYLVDGAPEGYAAGDLFASYVHLHFAGYPALLDHWLERCRAAARIAPSGGPSRMSALIVLGHGSRNAAATEQFHVVVDQLRSRRDEPVYAAFMELAEPSLGDAVAEAVAAGSAEIVVQPCFLFDGNHIRRDIPALLGELAAAYPDVAFRFGRPIGPDTRVADILLERAGEASCLA